MIHLRGYFLFFVLILSFAQNSLGNSQPFNFRLFLNKEMDRWYLPSDEYQRVKTFVTQYISVLNPKEYERWASNETVKMWHRGLILDSASLMPTIPAKFLPNKKFHYGENFSDAAWLDDIWLKIISTPTGSEICKIYTRGSEGILAGSIGLANRQSFDRFKYYCSDQKNDFFWSTRMKDFDIINTTVRYGSRVHFFVLDSSERARFDSWTFCVWNDCSSQKNIVVNLNLQSTEDDIIRILAHEWAMMADSRTRFNNSDIEASLKDSSLTCPVRSALAHPQIRMGLATLRAFSIENRILKELNSHSGGVTLNTRSSSCTEGLRNIMAEMKEFADHFINEAEDQLKANNQFSCKLTFASTPMENLLRTLESTVVDDFGNETSVCQKMLEYKPGFWATNHADFHPGPRPNIGDGGGSLSKNSEKIKVVEEQNILLNIQWSPSVSMKSKDYRLKKVLPKKMLTTDELNALEDIRSTFPRK